MCLSRMVYHSQSILWLIGKLCIFIRRPTGYIKLCIGEAVDIVRVIKNVTRLPVQEFDFLSYYGLPVSLSWDGW